MKVLVIKLFEKSIDNNIIQPKVRVLSIINTNMNMNINTNTNIDNNRKLIQNEGTLSPSISSSPTTDKTYAPASPSSFAPLKICLSKFLKLLLFPWHLLLG